MNQDKHLNCLIVKIVITHTIHMFRLDFQTGYSQSDCFCNPIIIFISPPINVFCQIVGIYPRKYITPSVSKLYKIFCCWFVLCNFHSLIRRLFHHFIMKTWNESKISKMTNVFLWCIR